MLIRGIFYSHICIKSHFVLIHYFESCLIASMVFASRLIEVSSVWTTSSTRAFSYPICTREDMSFVFDGSAFSVLMLLFDSSEEKSIDPLRSTMIFWAVFFPIPGTLERSRSSWSSIARSMDSVPSHRIFCAVLPPTPFTPRSFRNMARSVVSWNQKSVCPASVIWW